MKNLAGNSVAIFLYKFVVNGNRVDFILNESIAEDMYPEVDEEIKPLIHACCETLSRYKNMCASGAIMDGNILDDGCFEVMLKKGLGKKFRETEKQNLFKDADEIAKKLMEVMARRTKEMDNGTYPGPQEIELGRTSNKENIKRGLHQRGIELKKPIDSSLIRPNLKQLRPEDLPVGVVASTGYDHRGRCITFEHDKYGDLGRIVLIETENKEMKMNAEFCESVMSAESKMKKREIFQEVVRVIHEGFSQL